MVRSFVPPSSPPGRTQADSSRLTRSSRSGPSAMLAPADDDARMLRRTSAATSFWRLYQSDGLFRSSLDFTVIGLVVYWFVAPLPLPSLDWLKSTGASNPAGAGNQVAGTGTSPSASPITPADIAQAATPTRPKKLADKVRREWFKLSDPAIVPGLHKVADLIDNGAGAAEARAALDEIGLPDDLNVAYLSALAHLVSREKGASQRAYEEHLRAANAGHPAAMDQVGQLLRLGEGVKLDLAAAVEWYERGAAAGSAAA